MALASTFVIPQQVQNSNMTNLGIPVVNSFKLLSTAVFIQEEAVRSQSPTTMQPQKKIIATFSGTLQSPITTGVYVGKTSKAISKGVFTDIIYQ